LICNPDDTLGLSKMTSFKPIKYRFKKSHFEILTQI